MPPPPESAWSPHSGSHRFCAAIKRDTLHDNSAMSPENAAPKIESRENVIWIFTIIQFIVLYNAVGEGEFCVIVKVVRSSFHRKSWHFYGWFLFCYSVGWGRIGQPKNTVVLYTATRNNNGIRGYLKLCVYCNRDPAFNIYFFFCVLFRVIKKGDTQYMWRYCRHQKKFLSLSLRLRGGR